MCDLHHKAGFCILKDSNLIAKYHIKMWHTASGLRVPEQGMYFVQRLLGLGGVLEQGRNLASREQWEGRGGEKWE